MNVSSALSSSVGTSSSGVFNTDANSKPVRILSLDGGGVRGLSSLLILRRFMQQLSQRRCSPTTLLPCEVFDLIIGTSTGGIIALMLGRLRMSVDDCIDSYIRLARKVFGRPRAMYRLTGGLVALAGKSMYDKKVLESTLKNVIKQRTGHSGTFLGGYPHCRTAVVTALQEDSGHPVLFRSYDDFSGTVSNCCIWEAARATSAASLFFPPVAIGDPPRFYIDGAVSGNCNPALLAVREAEALWPDHPIGCLLSLGTGSPATIAVKGWIHELAKNFAALATECNRVHETLEHMYETNVASPYFRFSVVGALAKIRLDEWEEISPNGSGRLAALTDAYMSSHEQAVRLQKCLSRFEEYPTVSKPSPLLSNLTSVLDDDFLHLYKPLEKDPDLQDIPNEASLYANALFTKVLGIPLLYPGAVPTHVAVGDVGLIEWGRWKRIYNAMDSHNTLGLPILRSAKVDDPIPSLRSVYLSDAFTLRPMRPTRQWEFGRSEKAGAVLICNPAHVYETHLQATQVADYLKQYFNRICEIQGIEDTIGGICLIISMMTTADWAFEVQDTRSSSVDSSDAVISFKRYGTIEAESVRCWGSWSGTIGYVGPVRPDASSLRSAVVIRRWKAMRRPLSKPTHTHHNATPHDSDSKGGRGSSGKGGGPHHDGGGPSGSGPNRPPEPSRQNPSFGGNGGGVYEAMEPESSLYGDKSDTTSPSDHIQVSKMQEQDPLDHLLCYMFTANSQMHVAVASDHQLASLSEVPKSFTYLYHCTSTEVAVPQYAKARGCLGIKSAITDYASKLFTIWIDKNGYGVLLPGLDSPPGRGLSTPLGLPLPPLSIQSLTDSLSTAGNVSADITHTATATALPPSVISQRSPSFSQPSGTARSETTVIDTTTRTPSVFDDAPTRRTSVNEINPSLYRSSLSTLESMGSREHGSSLHSISAPPSVNSSASIQRTRSMDSFDSRTNSLRQVSSDSLGDAAREEVRGPVLPPKEAGPVRRLQRNKMGSDSNGESFESISRQIEKKKSPVAPTNPASDGAEARKKLRRINAWRQAGF